MPRNRHFFLMALVASVVTTAALIAQACPYCPSIEKTLGEKMSESDAACLVRFVASKNGAELSMQTTTFAVVKSLPMKQSYARGEEIVVPIGVTAEADDQFFLLGHTVDGEMEWALPIRVDELGRELVYISNAPSIELAQSQRLGYYWKYLDSKTPLIANDALLEFARAKFDDLELLATTFDRKKIRECLENPDPQFDVRRRFLGMLIGLCGNDDDARFLEENIFSPGDLDKNRLQYDGMMAGYVLLRGERGLRMLMEKKVDSVAIDANPNEIQSSDLNDVRMTLNFLWQYRRKQFTEESLKAAMRKFLNRVQTAESAIVDLARWKDWESLDPLIKAYGRVPWETRSAKEKIVAFALTCKRDGQTNSSQPSSYAVEAQKFLDGLDPEFVKFVERTISGPAPAAVSVKKSKRPEDCSN